MCRLLLKRNQNRGEDKEEAHSSFIFVVICECIEAPFPIECNVNTTMFQLPARDVELLRSD